MADVRRSSSKTVALRVIEEHPDLYDAIDIHAYDAKFRSIAKEMFPDLDEKDLRAALVAAYKVDGLDYEQEHKS